MVYTFALAVTGDDVWLDSYASDDDWAVMFAWLHETLNPKL